MPSASHEIKIGTRGSALALAQAHQVRDHLARSHRLPIDAFKITAIRTSGDRLQGVPLRDFGGKALFTLEIESALLAGMIDIAVHSMKDVAARTPAGLVIDCLLPREDVRDAIVGQDLRPIAEFPQGAVVGTSSPRRRAQVARQRPDVQLVEFRGNVDTRLARLRDGAVYAVLLAMAGLNRLGLSHVPRVTIEPDEALPAVAQGAIAVQRREGDERFAEFLNRVHHAETGHCVAAERAFLVRLDGTCTTPIAGLAQIRHGRLFLRGEIIRPDGSLTISGVREGMVTDGPAMGEDLAGQLISMAGRGFFDL